jgi:hypothetical protein
MEDVILISLGTIYGVIIYLYAYYKIMPETLPLKYKRERLKDARKALKK